jgi:thioester reductase-like protein
MTNVNLTRDQRQIQRFDDLCAVDATLRRITPDSAVLDAVCEPGLRLAPLLNTYVDGGRTDRSEYRSFDVLNPHDDGISLDVFLDWLIDAGVVITRIDDYHQWLTGFEIALTALPEVQRQRSALPLLHSYRQPETPLAGDDTLKQLPCCGPTSGNRCSTIYPAHIPRLTRT